MAKLGDFKIKIIGEDRFTPAAKSARGSTEQLSKATNGLKSSFGGATTAVKRFLPMLVSMAAAYKAYRLASSVVETALAYEKMQFQLRGVSDTIKEADAQFNMIRKFAFETPHMTEDVTQAFIMLKAVGLAPTIREMQIFGDVSFAMGRNIRDVSSAIIALETEVLRRLGVRIDRTGKMAIIQSGDIRREVVNDLTEIREVIIEVWEKRFAGAMMKGMETGTGAIMMYRSAISELKKTLGDLVVGPLTETVNMMTEAATKVKKWVDAFKIKMLTRDLDAYWERMVRIEKELEQVDSVTNKMAQALGLTRDRTRELIAEKMILELRIQELTQRLMDLTRTEGVNIESKKKLKRVTEDLTVSTKDLIVAEGEWFKTQYDYELEVAKGIKDTIKAIKEQKAAVEELMEAEQERGEVLRDFYMVSDRQMQDAKIAWDQERQEISETERAVNNLSDAFATGLAQGVAQMIVEGQKFGEVMKGVFRSLIAYAVQYIMKLLIIRALSGILGGATAASTPAPTSVRTSGMEYMQRGGVIREPIYGVGKSGKNYLFGERGPEVVTPAGAVGRVPNLVINVKNETGIPIEAKDIKMDFSAEDYVIGLCLRNIQKGGPLMYAIAGIPRGT